LEKFSGLPICTFRETSHNTKACGQGPSFGLGDARMPDRILGGLLQLEINTIAAAAKRRDNFMVTKQTFLICSTLVFTFAEPMLESIRVPS
jgi:hypothetical protein